MADPGPSDKLRQAVLAETEKQKKRAATNPDYARLLGTFLDACLTNLGRTRADFARALDIEPELADAVLDGLLPISEIDDGFLAEIAGAVGYEPNVLRALVGRAVVPSRREDRV